LTVTAPKTDEFDPQAYIALFLRGLVAVGLAWVALKLGVPIPDINTL
jgi:small basic protein